MGDLARGTFLWLLSNTVNRAAARAARSGHGPFSLVRHVGRKTGTVYETPLILARVADGFVAELTYGPDVDWYRNTVAAGRCLIIFRSVEHPVDAVAPCPTEEGLRAFGYPRSIVLRLLRRREFRMLHEQPASSGPAATID